MTETGTQFSTNQQKREKQHENNNLSNTNSISLLFNCSEETVDKGFGAAIDGKIDISDK